MRKKNAVLKRTPQVHYDAQIDALYIAMRTGAEEDFIEIAPGVHIELNDQKEVVGIEILNASQFLKAVLKPMEKRLQIAA